MPFFQSVINIQKKNIAHKIDQLDKLLYVENKNLVFIGTIGVGKTSTICSLFNLFDSTNANKKPILKTGSGATTICEVEIIFGEKYGIKIDPYSTNELKQVITEYVDTLVGNEMNIDGQPQQLTTEIERAIKYMIAPSDMAYRDIDAYIENMINQNNSNRNIIIEEFIRLAEIDQRNQVEFFNLDGIDDSKWLRTTFSDINDGLNCNASLPKKIYITIPSLNKYSNKIIDTKGIDSRHQNEKEFLREDLDRYIKNPDNIIIYCSTFPAAPDSDIMESINYYTHRMEDIHKRIILLIIPKHDEPMNVAGVNPNLEIDEYQQGIEIRKSTVNNQIRSQIRKPIYTIFHNSRIQLGFEIYNNNLEDIYNFQNELINQLKIERDNLENELNKLDIGDKIPPNLIDLEQQINNNIGLLNNELRILTLNCTNFIENYISSFRGKYTAANTKNAIHTRFGIFNSKNVYFDFEIHVEQIITSFLIESNLIAKLQHHLGIDQQITQQIIPSLYESFQNKSKDLCSLLINSLRLYFELNAKNYAFWQPMISRWGGGPGYNIDVCNRFTNQMNNLQIENEILNQFNEAWQNLVADFIADLG